MVGGEVKEARLRWYGHVQRKGVDIWSCHAGVKEQRTQRRFMDAVKEDMQRADLSEENATMRWRKTIWRSDP